MSNWPALFPPAPRISSFASPLEQIRTQPLPELYFPLGEEPSTGPFENPDAEHGIASGYRVVFSFDDGPHWIHTRALLRILEQRGIRASFFVNGYWLADTHHRFRENRRVLAAIREAGHQIGNHTFHHAMLPHLTPEEQAEEILANERIIQQVAGIRPCLFRPPYGAMTREAALLLRRHGYRDIRWNATAPDAEEQDPEAIRAQVMMWLRVHQGGIIMLHDRFAWSVQATSLILCALDRENCRRRLRNQPTFQVVSLDSLLQARAISWSREKQAEAERARHLERLEQICSRP